MREESNDKEDKLEENNEPAVKTSKAAMSTKSERSLVVEAACPLRQMPGHTGYLTFAVLYPYL